MLIVSHPKPLQGAPNTCQTSLSLSPPSYPLLSHQPLLYKETLLSLSHNLLPSPKPHTPSHTRRFSLSLSSSNLIQSHTCLLQQSFPNSKQKSTLADRPRRSHWRTDIIKGRRQRRRKIVVHCKDRGLPRKEPSKDGHHRKQRRLRRKETIAHRKVNKLYRCNQRSRRGYSKIYYVEIQTQIAYNIMGSPKVDHVNLDSKFIRRGRKT